MFQTKVVQKIKTYFFIFYNWFPKVVPFMRECGKIWWSQWGRRWQYDGALRAALVKATSSQAHARARAPTPTNAPGRARARMHQIPKPSHTQKYEHLLSSAIRRVIVTLYTHCLSLIIHTKTNFVFEVTEEWRRLHNSELYAVYLSPNIIQVTKLRRMRWAWHVTRMMARRGA